MIQYIMITRSWLNKQWLGPYRPVALQGDFQLTTLFKQTTLSQCKNTLGKYNSYNSGGKNTVKVIVLGLPRYTDFVHNVYELDTIYFYTRFLQCKFVQQYLSRTFKQCDHAFNVHVAFGFEIIFCMYYFVSVSLIPFIFLFVFFLFLHSKPSQY